MAHSATAVTDTNDAFADLQAAVESAQHPSQPSPYGPHQSGQVTPGIQPQRRRRRATVSTRADGTALPVVVVLSAADLAECGIDPAETDELIYWFDRGDFKFTTPDDLF